MADHSELLSGDSRSEGSMGIVRRSTWEGLRVWYCVGALCFKGLISKMVRI